MAITVKHTKVSSVPDSADTSLVRPSDWNDTHTLTGFGTAAELNAGVANGVATLDSAGKVPISEIPDSIIGALSYQGTWNATTNTPILTSSVGTKGYYYVVSVAGTINLNGVSDWQIGDWAVYNGTAWQKIDNTDSVTSVNGYTGAVVLTNTDISGFGTMSTQNANNVTITGGNIDGTTIGGTTPAVITGSTVSANTKFVSENYYAQSILGGNLRTAGGTSLVNWDGGGSGVVTINGGLSANPSNKNVSLAPTGTGTVTINPATSGTINNMVIGGTTPLAITGTTITATSFVGSGASLTNVVNSATAGTGISVSASTGAVTVTNTAPDQTVVMNNGTGISVTGTYPNFTVTNTAPSSGGTVTSVNGNGSVNGITLTGTVTSSGNLTLGGTLGSIANSQLTNSTITINGSPISLGGSISVGTVTSVTGTSPISSSGGATPAISISQANGSTNGYLSSTDWTTFNNKGSGSVTSVAASVPSFLSVSGSPITTTGTLAISYSGTALPIANGGTNATSYTAPSGNVSGLVFYNGTNLATDATTVTDAGYDTVLNTLNSRNFVANNGMICNSMTVTSSYTIPVGFSATATGPMTIATGQTVTISSGSRWVIL